MYCREIGYTKLLNGMIALTIFARTSDVERGLCVCVCVCVFVCMYVCTYLHPEVSEVQV